MVIVVALAAGAGYHYVVTRVDEQIRQHFEARLREHYQGLSVTVHSAELIEGEGIEIRGISIVQPTGEVLHAELAHIDEIVVKCGTDWQDLISQKINAERVTVRRLKMHAVRGDDGRWSIEQLFPLPKFGDTTAPISIQQGAIAFVDPNRGIENAMILREVNMAVIPETSAAEAISNAPPRLQINGEIKSDQFDRASFQGTYDAVLGDWSVWGNVESMKASSRLIDSLPINSTAAEPLQGLQASANFQFHVEGKSNDPSSIRFVAKGTVADGRYQNARLPYAITGIGADFHCNNTGWKIENVVATSGVTTLAGSVAGNRYDRFADFEVQLATKQLMLDERLVALLPPEIKDDWQKFSPLGTLNADLRLQRKGGLYFPSATIQCLDVSFAHEAFPYRLDHATGDIRWEAGRIHLDMIAWAGRQQVSLSGEFDRNGSEPVGSVAFATSGPIPIDQKLLAALETNPKAHAAFTALQPRGSMQASGTISRHENDGGDFDLQLNVGFHDCSVRYDGFAYPIDHIHGSAVYKDGLWTIRDLEGRNDSGLIRCSGTYQTRYNANDSSNHANAIPNGLSLNFRCWNVPLEEELRLALPTRMQQAWADVRPMGVIDQLNVDVTYGAPLPSLPPKLAVSIVAAKQPASPGVARGASLSIQPTWFPYRLDNVVGVARFTDGQITLDQIRAKHGRTEVSCQGTGLFNELGWSIELTRIAVDRMRADADLLAVLPSELQSFSKQLNIQGPISLQGAFTAAAEHRRAASLQFSWDMTVDLEDGSLQIGVPLEHVHGGIRLLGGSSGGQFVCSGEIAVDSLICKDIQLLDVRGPIWFDRQRLLVGGWAPRERKDLPPRRLSAGVFGGRIESDAQVLLRDHTPFSMQASLIAANLEQAVSHFAPNLDGTSGQAFGGVALSGDATGRHTLRGNGQVRLVNADIYEWPVMLSMLKLLSVTRPDTTAFTNSDIDFRVHGEHVYFDRINFNGDAISLRGNGEIDFERQLNLKFYTLVGSEKIRTRFLESVLGEASKQILMIQVTGSADNPEFKREAFPGINESLQQLFPELVQPREETKPQPRAAASGRSGGANR